MENNSLTQFGTGFQSKIITSCLLDTMFLQTVMEVLEPEYFESDANSWIVKEIYKYLSINKKEFLRMWVKNYIKQINWNRNIVHDVVVKL